MCCRLWKQNQQTQKLLVSLAKRSADCSPPLFRRPAPHALNLLHNCWPLLHLLTAGSASLQSSASHALTGRLFIIFICFFCQSTCGSSDLELKVCQGGEEVRNWIISPDLSGWSNSVDRIPSLFITV